MVTLLEITDFPIQDPNSLDLILSFKFLTFSFLLCLLLFLKCILASCPTLFILSTLFWLWSCVKSILACFLLSIEAKHSSSNHDLCCFNSCRPTICLADVLMFSFMFSQALFMSLSSLKTSKVANFVISIRYCFLTSSSFSFVRLTLSPSNLRAACLLTAYLSLAFTTPDSDQYHCQLPWNFVHLVRPNAISYLSVCVQSSCESSKQDRYRCPYEYFSVGTSCSFIFHRKIYNPLLLLCSLCPS